MVAVEKDVEKMRSLLMKFKERILLTTLLLLATLILIPYIVGIFQTDSVSVLDMINPLKIMQFYLDNPQVIVLVFLIVMFGIMLTSFGSNDRLLTSEDSSREASQKEITQEFPEIDLSKPFTIKKNHMEELPCKEKEQDL